MPSSVATNSVPLHVWIARHFVVVAAVVLLANYLQEESSLPTLLSYSAQFGGLIVVSSITAGLITLFSNIRNLSSYARRCTSILWVLALLLLVGSYASVVTNSSRLDPLAKTETYPQIPVTDGKFTVTIETLRERYPTQLSGKTDLEVAQMAYKAFKPDVPFEEFAQKIGAK